jgi:hypothetical protein
MVLCKVFMSVAISKNKGCISDVHHVFPPPTQLGCDVGRTERISKNLLWQQFFHAISLATLKREQNHQQVWWLGCHLQEVVTSRELVLGLPAQRVLPRRKVPPVEPGRLQHNSPARNGREPGQPFSPVLLYFCWGKFPHRAAQDIESHSSLMGRCSPDNESQDIGNWQLVH